MLILVGGSFLTDSIALGNNGLKFDFKFIKISVNKRDAYIVPAQQASEAMIWIDETMAPVKRDGYWTPATQAVEEADAMARMLIDFSRSNLSLAFPLIVQHPEKWVPNAKENATNEIGLIYKNRDHYSGQFVGYIVDGKKRIYCNYFDDRWPANLKINPSTRFMAVNDGGYGFWQVQYDVQTKTCLGLAINGP